MNRCCGLLIEHGGHIEIKISRALSLSKNGLRQEKMVNAGKLSLPQLQENFP